MSEVKARAESFCKRFGLRVPILLARMARACPPSYLLLLPMLGVTRLFRSCPTSSNSGKRAISLAMHRDGLR
jgi:hypothetical protein